MNKRMEDNLVQNVRRTTVSNKKQTYLFSFWFINSMYSVFKIHRNTYLIFNIIFLFVHSVLTGTMSFLSLLEILFSLRLENSKVFHFQFFSCTINLFISSSAPSGETTSSDMITKHVIVHFHAFHNSLVKSNPSKFKSYQNVGIMENAKKRLTFRQKKTLIFKPSNFLRKKETCRFALKTELMVLKLTNRHRLWHPAEFIAHRTKSFWKRKVWILILLEQTKRT